MTEAEWLAWEDPSPMLLHLEPTASDRKMRLFACACVWRVWHRVNDERLERVLLGLESFADGLITPHELEPLHNLAWEIDGDEQAPPQSRRIAYELGIATRVKWLGQPFMDDGPIRTYIGRFSASVVASGTGGQEEFQRRRAVERKQQTLLIRDIFANPFRPVVVSPAWRPDAAISLAWQIYVTRDFSAMSILADALEDAGCTNTDILDHCRQPGEHVRGCWVVDLVLGKA